MGFSCGLYKVKKYKDFNINDIEAINEYFDYQNNDWAKDNYPTWQDYCNRNGDFDYKKVDKEAIDFYRHYYIKREYGSSLFEEFDSWCSLGTCFHDWITGHSTKITESVYTLSKEQVIDALSYCEEELEKMKFKKVLVNKAFTEDEDSNIITSIHCDGIEVEDEDSNFRRYYTNDWDFSDVYVPVGYYDEDRYFAFTTFMKSLINILATTDFETELIEYNGGW